MSGLFEHLAATDDSERVAGRQAAAVANKRVKDQLGAFLANATDQADLDSRMSLVTDDIHRIAVEVGEEYGVVAERVESVIRDRYAKLATCDCGEAGCTCKPGECDCGSKTASCSDCGCETEGEDYCKSCADKKTSSEENMPEWLEDHFEDKEDGKHDDDDDEDEDDEDHEDKKESSDASADASDASEDGDDDDAVPFPASKKHKKHKSAEEQKDIEEELEHAPSAVGYGTMDGGMVEEPNNFLAREAAEAPEGSGGAVKREKLPTGNEDALGGPSPKIDKSKAGDEKGHKPSDIDTEYENSPVPEWRIEQDVTTGRGDVEKGTSDYSHDSPELTSDVLTKEELPTANEDGQSTERNIEQHSTDTFPNEGQAEPVTAASDPDRNPIRDIMEELDNDMSAVAEYERTASMTDPACACNGNCDGSCQR